MPQASVKLIPVEHRTIINLTQGVRGMPLAAGSKKQNPLPISRRTFGSLLQRAIGSSTNRRGAWPGMSRRSAQLLAAGGISRAKSLRIHKQGLIESSHEGREDRGVDRLRGFGK
jgi:hypothetical protein